MSDVSTSSRRCSRPEGKRILLVDEEADIRRILQIFLTEKGFQVKVAERSARALEVLEQAPVDLVLAEVSMSGMSGVELLRCLKQRDPEIDLVLTAAHSSVKDAVEVIQHGAADYVEKPIDFRRLDRVLASVFEKQSLEHHNRILQRQLNGCTALGGMIGRSPQMLEVFAALARLARYATTVLITGESGTGKELAAGALHRMSSLRNRPFVSCSCATEDYRLLETEIVGRIRGSFTGANPDHGGLSQVADGGSIFLDDIAELPLSLQAELLRALENRETTLMDSPNAGRTDVRVIAATSHNLADMVTNGTFRDDLYCRLQVEALHLPPLRERTEDIEPLCGHFIKRFNEKLGKKVAGLHPQALAVLLRAPWPGNVCELAEVIERAMAITKATVILPDHLLPYLLSPVPAPGESEAAVPAVASTDFTLEAAEREQIRRALEAASGKRIHAARLLGLSRRTLYRKLEKYGLQ